MPASAHHRARQQLKLQPPHQLVLAKKFVSHSRGDALTRRRSVALLLYQSGGTPYLIDHEQPVFAAEEQVGH